MIPIHARLGKAGYLILALRIGSQPSRQFQSSAPWVLRKSNRTRIILSESVADVDDPAVRRPVTKPVFQNFGDAVDIPGQQRPLLQIQCLQQWLIEKSSEIGFVDALYVESWHCSPHCAGSFARKMFVRQKFHAPASRRRLSASCKSASISSG